MPRISAFTGLVFDPAVVGPLDVVTAPPYDVIGERERIEFLRSSPYSVVHLDLSDDDATVDRYARAAGTLAAWRAEGALVLDVEPGYRAYEMRFRLGARDRVIRGLLCALELEEPGGTVIPHERTMHGPVEDRLRLLRATRTNLSPVYGTVAGPCPPLGELLDSIVGTPPTHAVTDGEGVLHRSWPVPDDPRIPRWLADEPLLIADGHHRYATALRYRDERRAEAGNVPGPWDRLLALVVDAGSEQPPVLPFHRVVSNRAPPAVGELVHDLQEVLTELDDEGPTYGTVTLEEGAVVHRVATLDGRPPSVAALHDQVLGTVDEGDIAFTPDAVEAETAVRTGRAVAAYLLPPTSTERIRRVIAGGQRLPQKSTFFWPKPRTGMVLRPLE